MTLAHRLTARYIAALSLVLLIGGCTATTTPSAPGTPAASAVPSAPATAVRKRDTGADSLPDSRADAPGLVRRPHLRLDVRAAEDRTGVHDRARQGQA